ncbi:Uncharacterized protein Rs2_18314 [Raphanus sativus]|nr:Uncharacterized protein Rs2_18314 [Raphanus sativus]
MKPSHLTGFLCIKHSGENPHCVNKLPHGGDRSFNQTKSSRKGKVASIEPSKSWGGDEGSKSSGGDFVVDNSGGDQRISSPLLVPVNPGVSLHPDRENGEEEDGSFAGEIEPEPDPSMGKLVKRFAPSLKGKFVNRARCQLKTTLHVGGDYWLCKKASGRDLTRSLSPLTRSSSPHPVAEFIAEITSQIIFSTSSRVHSRDHITGWRTLIR